MRCLKVLTVKFYSLQLVGTSLHIPNLFSYYINSYGILVLCIMYIPSYHEVANSAKITPNVECQISHCRNDATDIKDKKNLSLFIVLISLPSHNLVHTLLWHRNFIIHREWNARQYPMRNFYILYSKQPLPFVTSARFFLCTIVVKLMRKFPQGR